VGELCDSVLCSLLRHRGSSSFLFHSFSFSFLLTMPVLSTRSSRTLELCRLLPYRGGDYFMGSRTGRLYVQLVCVLGVWLLAESVIYSAVEPVLLFIPLMTLFGLVPSLLWLYHAHVHHLPRPTVFLPCLVVVCMGIVCALFFQVVLLSMHLTSMHWPRYTGLEYGMLEGVIHDSSPSGMWHMVTCVIALVTLLIVLLAGGTVVFLAKNRHVNGWKDLSRTHKLALFVACLQLISGCMNCMVTPVTACTCVCVCVYVCACVCMCVCIVIGARKVLRVP
jgi:hypothetical protein